MTELSLSSQIIGYVLIAIIGLYMLLLGWWQAKVLSGRSMKNADGSTDDWKAQKTHYGIALADLFLALPGHFHRNRFSLCCTPLGLLRSESDRLLVPLD